MNLRSQIDSLEEDLSEVTKQRQELQTKVKSITEICHELKQKLHRCACVCVCVCVWGGGGGGGG